jgi:biotin synthase-related radical SAM superfamily protein
MTVEEKAELVSIGSVRIGYGIAIGGATTTATAGPGAGGTSIFVRSGVRRVRLAINPASPLTMVPREEGIAIVREGRVVAEGTIEQPLCHCPRQAYITVSERCIFDCQFCPVPRIQGGVKEVSTILDLVRNAEATGELDAISLTSGVAESPSREAERMVRIVKALRCEYDLPIGVSIYPAERSTENLYAAGATEIKYNVETMDPALFRLICPRLSLDIVLNALAEAAHHFGKNHVTSNFIIGLGDSDACVHDGVEDLASRGVIPILRPIAISPLRQGTIPMERPTAARLLSLASMERAILDRYGLRADRAATMCLPCTGCDITPHRDV